MSLTGKVALVTGARTGLGAAIAIALAEAGATVIAAGRRAGDCAATVAAAGNGASDMALDIGDLAALPERAAALLARHGRLDVVVNNAATIEPMAPLGTIDAAAFDAAMRINVTGPATLVSALWPALVEAGGARIVNIVSGAANRALAGWAAYCASKAALLALARSIELEGKEHGIRGFAFAPGLVDTGMQDMIRAAKINEVSSIPRENLLPPSRPAAFIAALAAGRADDLAGTFLDVRQEDLAQRLGV